MYRSLVLSFAGIVTFFSVASAAITWYTGIPSEIQIVQCKPMAASTNPEYMTNTTGAPVMYVRFAAGGWGYYLLNTPESWKVYDLVVAAKNGNKNITMGYHPRQSGDPASYLAYTAVDNSTNVNGSNFPTVFIVLKQ